MVTYPLLSAFMPPTGENLLCYYSKSIDFDGFANEFRPGSQVLLKFFIEIYFGIYCVSFYCESFFYNFGELLCLKNKIEYFTN